MGKRVAIIGLAVVLGLVGLGLLGWMNRSALILFAVSNFVPDPEIAETRAIE